MKKHIITVAVMASLIPVAALAGPSLGIGYSNVGLSGHAGRPGVTLSAGNIYSNNVVATGGATFASNYYGLHADLGKLIPAGSVSFEPYASIGFLNLNYNQPETGYTTQTTSIYGYSFSYQSPYSYTSPQSIQDFYGMAGANMNVPIGQKVMLQFGGGYGHTISTFGGAGGAVYKGKAEIGFEIAPRVTADIDVRYLHVPGANLTTEGAGISYHFS